MINNETRYNLQHDWHGMLEWNGILDPESRREIINAVVLEIDAYRNQNVFRRLLNKMPEVKILK